MGIFSKGDKKSNLELSNEELKLVAEAFVVESTSFESICRIFSELLDLYQSQDNVFLDDDSKLREFLWEPLMLAKSITDKRTKLGRKEKQIIERAWINLFSELEETDFGYKDLDDLLTKLDETLSNDEDLGYEDPYGTEFPDLVSEAKSPDITPERLYEMTSDSMEWFNDYEEVEVKVLIAKNKKTPLPALERLSECPAYEVRLLVTENPNCDKKLLNKLKNDKEAIVRNSALKRLA